MVDALKRNTRAAAPRDREQAIGERLRIDALDRDDLDIHTMRRAHGGQCFGQNLGRSARMRGKEDVETPAAARRDAMAEIAPRDFANGLFNPRDRFLMDAAAPYPLTPKSPMATAAVRAMPLTAAPPLTPASCACHSAMSAASARMTAGTRAA